MENESKKKDLIPAGSDLVGPLDSTSRARNRTVMLTPEMTGHMRSKMLDSGFQSDEARSARANSGWEDEAQEPFGGRLIGHEPKVEDDSNDWARPIEPATFGDDDDQNDVGEHQSMSWTPGGIDEPEEVASANGYHIEESVADTTEDNEPFISHSNGHYPKQHQAKKVAKESTMGKGTGSDVEEQFGSDTECISWKQITPVAGFLVSYDNDPNGSVITLRTGRIIVTSESDGTGNIFLIRHETVSPMHAIMRVGIGGTIQLLDQLSETGTRIVRAVDGQEEMLCGEKANIQHGDTIYFGDRKFHVCLVNTGTSLK